MVLIVIGGGGAGLHPVDASPGGKCSQVYSDTGEPVVAVARGWSSSGGSACNGAAKPNIGRAGVPLRAGHPGLGNGTG